MFAQRLREIRNEKDISQTKLAELIKATQTQISKWETGTIEPSLKQLKLLSDVLEVSTDYLLGRSNDIGIVEIQKDLTPEQSELLNLYNKMSVKDKSRLIGFAQGLVE